MTACSGDDDATSTTTAPPTTQSSTTLDDTTTTTTTTTTTEPGTATTSSPTTAAPTTVETTEPPSPTTQPPDDTTTTTVDPTDAEVRQAVIDATIASWETLNEARLDPTNDEKLAALREVRTGESLERAALLLGEYNLNNQREVTNSDYPARVDVYPETFVIDPATGTASIEYCELASNTWVEVGGNPDGSDRVINDAVNSNHKRADLELTDGVWLESDGVLIQKTLDSTTCENTT